MVEWESELECMCGRVSGCVRVWVIGWLRVEIVSDERASVSVRE